MNLTLLYRGPLASCNYTCGYCPFAKREDDKSALENDRLALERLRDWVEEQREHRITLFFTPWGEALVRPWYREAITRLSAAEAVEKIVVQTNLSTPMKWVENCQVDKLRIWATYHPGQCRRERFVAACRALQVRGVRMSVGTVGIDRHRDEIAALRTELPPELYLWVNAWNDNPGQYDAAARHWYAQIDPLFSVTCQNHASLGHDCRAGHDVLSVAGDGTLRRCHFIDAPIGNLYEPGFWRKLRLSPCTNNHCNCYIGYVHLPHLGFDNHYGAGLIERIPCSINGKADVVGVPQG